MKLIMQYSKVDNCLLIMNTAVRYEMDYYILDQEIIFILSRAENVQNRN